MLAYRTSARLFSFFSRRLQRGEVVRYRRMSDAAASGSLAKTFPQQKQKKTKTKITERHETSFYGTDLITEIEIAPKCQKATL
jgi:hypothetical protein